MSSARRSDGAKYAIPSHFVLLTNPVSSSTQPQGIISNTPQKSVGCLRLCLRLCLRVAKIRTFAPLLVLSLCSKTIALLSDFCSAGWAAHAAFLSQGIISNTPQVMRGVRFLPHAKNQRFFPRGPRLCLRLCPTKCPRFAAVLCGDPVAPCVNSARRSDGAKYAIPSLRSLQIRSHRDPPKRATAGCTHNLRLTPARLLFEAAFSSCNRNDARPE